MAPASQDGQDLVDWVGFKDTREVKKEDLIQVQSTEAATSRMAVTAVGRGDDFDGILAALAIDIADNGSADEPRYEQGVLINQGLQDPVP